MQEPRISLFLAPLVIFSIVGGGCITGQSQQADFFVLGDMPGDRPSDANFLQGASFHVAQTEIPAYLEGSRMVKRTSANQLSYAEFHRWSETLDLGISRVVANNLSSTLNILNFSHYPNRPRPSNHYQITVTVQQFERIPNGKIVFKGSWRLFVKQEQKLIVPLEESAPINGVSHDAMVRAMNTVLRKVSDHMVKRLVEHHLNESDPTKP
ncbi:MAG: PqiC family protein [Opitutales bacterium]